MAIVSFVTGLVVSQDCSHCPHLGLHAGRRRALTSQHRVVTSSGLHCLTDVGRLAAQARLLKAVPRPLSFVLPLQRRSSFTSQRHYVFADDMIDATQSPGPNDSYGKEPSRCPASLIFEEADSWLDAVCVTAAAATAAAAVSPLLGLWKPRDAITTMNPSEGKTLLPVVERASASVGWSKDRLPQPVGRLDKNTTGLMFLTDNGDLNRILNIRGGLSKTYVATINKLQAHPHQLSSLLTGVDIGDGKLAVAQDAFVSGTEERRLPDGSIRQHVKVCIRLKEGRRHVVKRMLQAVGLPLQKLHRETVGNVSCCSLGLRGPGDAKYVPADVLLELIGRCGVVTTAVRLAGHGKDRSHEAEEAPPEGWACRGRAVYNALRCGLLLCNLRQGRVHLRHRKRLDTWLRKHWTVEGPCLGPFHELCPTVAATCACEASGSALHKFMP